MPLCHLSIYHKDLFACLKLACIKNQNIKKKKSKFESLFDGDHDQLFLNYRDLNYGKEIIRVS